MVIVAVIATLLFVPESPIKTPGRINWLGAALLVGWLVCRAGRRQRGLELGLDERPDDRPVRSPASCCWSLWVAQRVARARAARRHADDAHPRRLDRQRGGVPRRRRDVLVVRPDPAVRVESRRAPATASARRCHQAGLFLAPSTLGMLLLGPVSGRLSERVGSRVPLILGGIATTRRSCCCRRARPALGDLRRRRRPRRRHRPRVRVAGEPDRRGGPARADRRRDRHEHGDANARRLGRRPDRRQRPRGHGRRRGVPTEAGFTSRSRWRRGVRARHVGERRRPAPGARAGAGPSPGLALTRHSRRDCADEARPARPAVRRAA